MDTLGRKLGKETTCSHLRAFKTPANLESFRAVVTFNQYSKLGLLDLQQVRWSSSIRFVLHSFAKTKGSAFVLFLDFIVAVSALASLLIVTVYCFPCPHIFQKSPQMGNGSWKPFATAFAYYRLSVRRNCRACTSCTKPGIFRADPNPFMLHLRDIYE
jgi:hypothetical protein